MPSLLAFFFSLRATFLRCCSRLASARTGSRTFPLQEPGLASSVGLEELHLIIFVKISIKNHSFRFRI